MSEETQIDPTFPIPGDVQILVSIDNSEQKTESGIIVVNQTANANKDQVTAPFIGFVKAVGCNCKRQFLDPIDGKRTLRIGDRIIFNRYANLTITTPKLESYLLMDELNAYCLIPKENVVTTLKQKPQARPNIDRDSFRKKLGLDQSEDVDVENL